MYNNDIKVTIEEAFEPSVGLINRALDATNWYGEYTLLEDVDKEEKELSCMKCGSKKNLKRRKDLNY